MQGIQLKSHWTSFRMVYEPTNTSITSFASLTDRLVEQFTRSRNLEKTADELYEIVTKKGEPLVEYVRRFDKKKVLIPSCSVFKRRIHPNGGLYKELTKYQC